MKVIRFDREQPIPLIDAWIYGPRVSRRVKLIFDTGAQFSIMDTGLIEEIGYSARDALQAGAVYGAAGEAQEGYLLQLNWIQVFGKRIEQPKVGAFDFVHSAHFGAEGVLGFDVIRDLHLEMDGPGGLLRIF